MRLPFWVPQSWFNTVHELGAQVREMDDRVDQALARTDAVARLAERVEARLNDVRDVNEGRYSALQQNVAQVRAGGADISLEDFTRLGERLRTLEVDVEYLMSKKFTKKAKRKVRRARSAR